MTLSDSNSRIKQIIYLTFTVIIFWMHLPMQYFNDDLFNLPNVQSSSLWDFFIDRLFYNGKIFTDVLANLFWRLPMMIWKVFDTLVYLLIAVLITRTFSHNTWQDALVTCILIGLFPFWYMSTAGWVATTTNYLYPTACLLVVCLLVKRLYHGQLLKVHEYILAAVSILYATNQDQAAVILIGGLLLVLLYCWATKVSKQILIRIAVLLGFAVISYLFMFLLPGHINRMQSTEEMEQWLPEYANWSVFKKVYRAYTSTVAVLMFYDVKLFDVFCILLFFVASHSGKIHQKLVGAVPFVVVLGSRLIGSERFVIIPSYTGGMPELAGLSAGWKGITVVLLTVCVVLCIFYTVFSCINCRQSKWQILLFLILGAGSRLMMGFSATLYASHARTFTYLLFSLILSSVILLKELRKEKPAYFYIGVGSMAASLLYIVSPLVLQESILG